MRVTDAYFSGKESLAIKVSPEAFDSDPDLFISKVSNENSLLLHVIIQNLLITN